MKRSFIRSFSIDEDIGDAFKLAQEKLHMSGSEIVNRLLLEWMTETRPGSIAPPFPLKELPLTITQRAKALAARESSLRKR